MKKKIAILGSTGSIGKTLISVLKKDKKNFDIVLLTTNKNYNLENTKKHYQKKLFGQPKCLETKYCKRYK